MARAGTSACGGELYRVADEVLLVEAGMLVVDVVDFEHQRLHLLELVRELKRGDPLGVQVVLRVRVIRRSATHTHTRHLGLPR